MSIEDAIHRAQIYGFLAEAFLYPHDNWTEDVALVADIAESLGWITAVPNIPVTTLTRLQEIHRYTFGVAGSLCYETEYGLPHEYRQSQEMADIAGFYRAFGFQMGGAVRERPDHVAVELEFMHLMALKEAFAFETGITEHVEVCLKGQRDFLSDHLGRWIELFAQSVIHNASNPLFGQLARFASTFVAADAERMGISLDQPQLTDIQHTPYDPDYSCATCDVAGVGEQGFIPTQLIKRSEQ